MDRPRTTRRCFAPAAISLASLAFAAGATAQQADDGGWADHARQDVVAAYEIYVEDHPGYHDPENPGFRDLLRRARDAGLHAAEHARDHRDYAEALAAFSGVLEDGHALLFAKPAEPGGQDAERRWPGFVAAWRGALRVHRADESSPVPAGTAILGCDGLDAAELMRERLRSRGLRASEAGQLWFRAPQLFAPTATYAYLRPESCRFRLPEGEVREIPLAWSPAPDDLVEMITRASDGERTPIGLGQPRPGLFLVGLPDFAPDEAGVQAYRSLYQELAERRDELKAARAIVLDLRHNNGGSSTWPRSAARVIWGAEAVDERMARFHAAVRIRWRASERNTDHVVFLEEHVRNQGNSDFADNLRHLAGEMRAAQERGDPLVDQPIGDGEGERGPVPPTDLATPVYVITPGRCASACLDALDVFTRFETVTLIGAPTSADSPYMEVRAEDLPSGHGRIVVPVKLWAGRARAGGEIYEPRIVMDELDWSTASFLDRIERDLAEREPASDPSPVG